MTTDSSHLLLLHGAIVVGLGLLTGVPFWIAILRADSPERLRAWRVAHTTVLMDGLLLLVAGLMRTHLDLTVAQWAVAEWALVVSAYAFGFALIGGAWAGERGLNPTPTGVRTLFFLGHAIGATGAFVGVGLLIRGLVN